MKSKITFLLLTLFMCVSNSYSQFDAQHPDLRLCGSAPNYYLDVFNCNSNNFTLRDVFLSLTNVNGQPMNTTTCTIGTTQSVYVMLNYTSNASNTPNNGRLFADLTIDNTVIPINAYLGNIPPGNNQRQIYGPFLWTCGQELTLSRILVVWRTGGGSTMLPSYSCSTYSSSQCELPGSTVITKPLAVQFTYKACKVGNNTTVAFTSTTNGGTPPYTYAWDFDNNGTTDSTLANPTFTYTTANNTAKLTVTDALGLSNSYTLNIVSPTELMLSETHVNVSCGGGNTGSIDLSVTDGTPGYTYLWSNGATTQDLSGLGAGTYTVTVKDANNCQKTLTVTISGGDAIAPVVTAPANVTLQGCNSSSIATAGFPAYSSSQVVISAATFTQLGGNIVDASAINSITYQDVQTGTCPKIITRTFRVTDVCNNVGTAVQIIRIEDTTGPVFEPLTPSMTVSCPNLPVFEAAKAIDSCDNFPVLTFNDVTTNGDCVGSYSVTRTWTATDACGNSSTASQTITVTDTAAPVIAALPAPSTISCPATPSFATATATDACGSGATLTFNDVTTNGACAGSYSVTRTWTAVDACGNSSTASQTINVIDNTAPAIAALPAPSTISCPATPSFATATATDACGSGATLSFNDVTTNGACAGSYSVTRTWTAVDACGNSSTASQTITVTNTNAPVIAALPAPSTISCPATPSFATATATVACGSGANLTFNDVTTNGACAGSYSVTRTWTAVDACGNSSTASQTISVIDNTAPVISVLPAPSTISCPATPSFATATATDACGSGATLTFNDVTTNGACAGSYSVTRTWTAVDACGNSSIASQTINVQDTTAPVIASLPAPSTISCPATPSFATATATDACGSGATLTFNDVTSNGACAGSYSVTRTWTAVDACGNSSTASQTINVQDTTAPVIASLPAPSTISCPSAPEFAQATATDACGSGATLTFDDVTTNSACAGSYSVTRTWTAVDACGNSSTASQTINVIDNTAPVIAALPAASTISCPATPSFATATATDACGSGATLTFNDITSNGACAGSYSVTRTWTAVDACGNSSTASQTINVQDTTAPVIASLPAPSTISCPSAPEFAQATATDACGSGATLTFDDVTTNGACAGSFSVTRTWTAVDACGNSSTASQTINVQDTTAPVIASLPAPSTISCPSAAEFAQATATDACGSGATLTFNDVTTDGACAGSYSITRTWTAVDACGNSSTASQTINVQDTTAPVIASLPAPSTISCPATPSFATATATDACSSGATLTFNDVTTNGACAGSYSVTRTWTATDACGNSSTASQVINVQDITAPVIAALPAASTISCPSAPEFAQATATDACGSGATLTFDDVATNGACAGSYSVTRTWTAVDACGNSSTASQTITVTDTTAPAIAALPAPSTISCPSAPEFAQATATDVCGSGATLTFDDVTTNGACAGSYSVTRTWTAVDACGNSSTASQTINVQDTAAPVIAALPAASTISCPSTPGFAQATATDECGSSFDLTFADVTTNTNCAGNYSITRTWTAVDTCGNTATASQTINVQDITAPIINTQASNIVVECDGTGNQVALANWLATSGGATATDECSAVTWSNNFSAISNDCSAAVIVIFTATDECGNTSTTSASFSINDTQAPVAPQAPASVTVACTADIPAMISLSATDNCSTPITVEGTDTITPGTCTGTFTVTRTWTFVDACANTTSVSQTINVVDDVAPVAPQAPANVTVSCEGDVPAMVSLSATDNCGDVITVEGTDATTQGACTGTYTIIRTWTFTDACNNSSSVSQTINVVDDVAPVAPQAPANVTIACEGDVPAMVSLSATDNCGDVITVQGVDSTVQGNCANSFIITRTWTFTDACNNTSSVSQTINVVDDVAPVTPQAPANITVACEGDVPAMVSLSATDNCGDVITVEGSDATTPGACNGTYAITRTWTFTDACNNSSSVSQTINVIDDVAPVTPQAPANVTVACEGDVPAMVSLNATDNCGDVITVQGVDSTVQGDCANSFIITRTWTFTDACNNTSSVSQTINVVDDVAPVAPQAPANVTVACEGDVPAMVSLTATDNCGDVITVEGADATTPGACNGTYTITRTWTFTDACNNTSSVSQTINVVDDVAPVTPQAPANVTVACEGDVPAMVSLSATDNCGDVITIQGVDSTVQGDCANSFIITRTWTFTDACSNTSSVSQTINVIDDVAPVTPQAPAEVTVACAGDVPATVSLTATDNCGEVITVLGVDSTVQGTCANSFIITRTWTFTDACNNTSSVSQTINVIDNLAPTAPQAPASISLVCVGEVPPMISLTATDNCGESITSQGVDSTVQGSCPNSFVVTRTWSFTDACGNTSSVSQTISVDDNVPPTINEATPLDTAASCDNIPAPAVLTASDNCGTATVTMTETILAGNCPSNYQIVRTWVATDACGNNSVAVAQTISVTDSVGPQIIIPIDPKLMVTCDFVPEAPVLTAADFTDNCSTVGTPVFTQTQTEPDTNGVYQIVRTWTVSDACGNTTTITQSIAVTQQAQEIEVNVTDEICNDEIEAAYDLATYLPVGTPTGGTWVNESNVGTFNGSVFNSYQVTAGSYTFSYTYQTTTCPGKVNINLNVIKCGIVEECQLIIIHNAFTPNNDPLQLNEYFSIEHIEDFDCYPTNKVEIFNRWGVLVYETENYDNNTRKFVGISEGRSTVSKSEELPTGTYFYIVQWTTTEGNTETRDGYLYLTR